MRFLVFTFFAIVSLTGNAFAQDTVTKDISDLKDMVGQMQMTEGNQQNQISELQTKVATLEDDMNKMHFIVETLQKSSKVSDNYSPLVLTVHFIVSNIGQADMLCGRTERPHALGFRSAQPVSFVACIKGIPTQ